MCGDEINTNFRCLTLKRLGGFPFVVFQKFYLPERARGPAFL